jgi:predicted Fe-Mo cluster-binding NifX family protein
MKIAVTAENNNGLESLVAQHFGHAPFFILVDVKNGELSPVQAVANPFAKAHQPGQIPEFIKYLEANVILSGGMGGQAIKFFKQAGIKAATGASGTVRQALDQYLADKLEEAAPCEESVSHGHNK